MKKIDSLTELKNERRILRQKELRLKNEIQLNISEIKESFSPSKLITDGAKNILVNKNHGVVNDTINLLTDLLLKKTVLRNAGFLIRLIVPLVTRNTVNNLVHSNKTKILGMVGELILKAGSRKNNNAIYDRTTAGDDY